MKICLLQSKLYLLVFALLFCVLSFPAISHASTLDNSMGLSESNHYQTEPYMQWTYNNTATCEDSIMIVSWTVANTNSLNNGKFDGQNIVKVGEYSSSNETVGWGYILNPTTGSHVLELQPTTWAVISGYASVICGVNQTTPIKASSTLAQLTQPVTFTTGVNSISVGDTLISILGGTAGSLTTDSNNNYDQGNWTYYSNFSYQNSTSTNTMPVNWYGHEGSAYSGGWIVLNNATPPTIGTVWWAGVGQQNTLIGHNYDIPFYWNVCDHYGAISSLKAVLQTADGLNDLAESNPLIEKGLGPNQCSGIAYITTKNDETTPNTSSEIIKLYNPDDPGQNIAISTPFNDVYTYWKSGTSTNNFITPLIKSPLIITTASSIETTITFNYDFTGVNMASSTIDLYDESSQNYTQNGINSSSLTGAGQATLTIQNGNASYGYTADIRAFNSNGVILTSKPFQIQFIGNLNNPIVQLMGTSTYDVACTPEEWASENVFINIKCNAFYTTLKIVDKISSAPINAINGTIEIMKQLFPFNVFTHIYDSWVQSKTNNLPTNLLWLNNIIDINGNIYLESPHFNGVATTSTAVFGPATANGNNDVLNYYAMIHSLSTWAFWGLFFMYQIIHRAARVKNKL